MIRDLGLAPLWRRPALPACRNVGVGELGAGGLLGSTSAGVGDGGGCCCCWFAVMVTVSAVATHGYNEVSNYTLYKQ